MKSAEPSSTEWLFQYGRLLWVPCLGASNILYFNKKKNLDVKFNFSNTILITLFSIILFSASYWGFNLLNNLFNTIFIILI